MAETDLQGFLCVAPSTVQAGQEFCLKLKGLTTPHHVASTCYSGYPRVGGAFNLSPRGILYMDNGAPRWDGPLQFESEGDLSGPGEIDCTSLPGSFSSDKRAIGEIPGFSFPRSGTYTIRVTDSITGVSATSNPIEVSDDPPELKLFWGDLHSQTFFSDGLRVPEELYHFARHESFLDICAVSDHAEWLTDAQWNYFTQVTNESYEPGAYVTFNGLEWTNSDIGHRNVYYPGDYGPIVRAGQDDLETVYEIARQHNALVIPHHSANVTMGVKWDTAHDPEHVRLVEIYSIWGNSERPETAGNPRPIRSLGGEQDGQHVIDALARGYQMGFIGGGDIHDGRPGDELHTLQKEPEQYRHLSRQGIMGVWATELTREAVWDALWNRRVYATSNVRVIVRFEVCGAPMGQRVQAAGPRNIHVRAASEVPIAHVEIVKNGQDWRQMTPDSLLVDWETEDVASLAADTYYARITRVDGELAWSSPVWVNSSTG